MSKLTDVVAHNLVRLRNSKDISQDKLAKLIGVSRQTINRYEAGTGGIGLDTIAKLAEVLEVEETDLTAPVVKPPTTEELVGIAVDKTASKLVAIQQLILKGRFITPVNLSKPKQDLVTVVAAMEEDHAEAILRLLKSVDSKLLARLATADEYEISDIWGVFKAHGEEKRDGEAGLLEGKDKKGKKR